MIAHAISSWRTGALLHVALVSAGAAEPQEVRSPGSPLYRVVRPPAQAQALLPRAGSGQFVVYMKCKHTRRAGVASRNAIAWL
jgi:hypothetical protein